MSNAPFDAGAAAIVIRARYDIVHAIIVDFSSYENFMPNFKRSRVIARKPEGTDVYLQVPVLKGAARIWTVARFETVTKSSTEATIFAHSVNKGNIKDFRAVWHIAAIDADHTLLQLELLVVPNFPVPGSLVTSALEESADNGVTACRSRAEQRAAGQEN